MAGASPDKLYNRINGGVRRGKSMRIMIKI